MFDTQKFRIGLDTLWLGADFIYTEKAGSTNLLLKKKPDQELRHGTVLLADTQHSGRGQFGRKWESEPGKNLTFTMAFKPTDTTRLPYLTLATAWAISYTLSSSFPIKFCVKWPNDLMAEKKKVGGLLTESVFTGKCLNRVLVGVGLNTGQARFSKKLETSASSIALLTGTIPDREHLLASMLKQIELAYQRWEKNDKSLLTDVNQSLDGYGQWVRIFINGMEVREEVKFLGINEHGQLVILTKEYEVTTFSHEQIRIQSPDT